MNIISHVKAVNHRELLWLPGARLVIGVSGGPDSMCLLDVMVRIAKKEDLRLIVAHVNYGIRGKQADRDAAFVQRRAQDYGIPCEVTTKGLTGRRYSEEELRDIRYDFFETVRSRNAAIGVLLAHNQNDQAETMLMHLLRGAGLRGLSGMKFSRDFYRRPFLGISRDDIMAYLKEHNLPYRRDRTNADTTYTRNHIRKRLLPYLARHYNPSIVQTLGTSATHIADDDAFIELGITCSVLDETSRSLLLSAREFCDNHAAVQRRCLWRVISHFYDPPVGFTVGHIEEYRKAMHSTKGKVQTVTINSLQMTKRGNRVRFMKA